VRKTSEYVFEEATRFLSLTDQDSLIDFGAGGGYFIDFIKAKGHHPRVVAVDNARGMIEALNRKADHVLRLDIRNLKDLSHILEFVPVDGFSKGVLMEVNPHLTVKEFSQFLNWVSAHLAANGKFFISLLYPLQYQTENFEFSREAFVYDELNIRTLRMLLLNYPNLKLKIISIDQNRVLIGFSKTNAILSALKSSELDGSLAEKIEAEYYDIEYFVKQMDDGFPLQEVRNNFLQWYGAIPRSDAQENIDFVLNQFDQIWKRAVEKREQYATPAWRIPEFKKMVLQIQAEAAMTGGGGEVSQSSEDGAMIIPSNGKTFDDVLEAARQLNIFTDWDFRKRQSRNDEEEKFYQQFLALDRNGLGEVFMGLLHNEQSYIRHMNLGLVNSFSDFIEKISQTDVDSLYVLEDYFRNLERNELQREDLNQNVPQNLTVIRQEIAFMRVFLLRWSRPEVGATETGGSLGVKDGAMNTENELKNIVVPLAEKVYIAVEPAVKKMNSIGPVYARKSACHPVSKELLDRLGTNSSLWVRNMIYYNSKQYLANYPEDLIPDTRKNPGDHEFLLIKYKGKFWIVDPTWQQFLPSKKQGRKEHVLIVELRGLPKVLKTLGVPLHQSHVWRNAFSESRDVIDEIKKVQGYKDFKLQDLWPDQAMRGVNRGKASLNGAMNSLTAPIKDPNEILSLLPIIDMIDPPTLYEKEETVGLDSMEDERALAIIKHFGMFKMHADLIYDNVTKKGILITGASGSGKSSITSRLIKRSRFSIWGNDSVVAYFGKNGTLYASFNFSPSIFHAMGWSDLKNKFVPIGTIVHLTVDLGVKKQRIIAGKLDERFNNDRDYKIVDDKENLIRKSNIFGINILIPKAGNRNYDAITVQIQKVLLSDRAMTGGRGASLDGAMNVMEQVLEIISAGTKDLGLDQEDILSLFNAGNIEEIKTALEGLRKKYRSTPKEMSITGLLIKVKMAERMAVLKTGTDRGAKADGVMNASEDKTQEEMLRLWNGETKPVWNKTFNPRLFSAVFGYASKLCEEQDLIHSPISKDNPYYRAYEILVDSILNMAKDIDPKLWEKEGGMLQQYISITGESPTNLHLSIRMDRNEILREWKQEEKIARLSFLISNIANMAWLESTLYRQESTTSRNPFLNPFLVIMPIAQRSENKKFETAFNTVTSLAGWDNQPGLRGLLEARRVCTKEMAAKITMSVLLDSELTQDVVWNGPHFDIKYSVYMDHMIRGDVDGFVKLLAQASPAMQASADEAMNADRNLPFAGKRLLIFEDDPSMMKVFQHMYFNAGGAQGKIVSTLNQLEEIMEREGGEAYDLLIVDWDQMNRLRKTEDMLDRLKTNFPKQKVVVVTGAAMPQEHNLRGYPLWSKLDLEEFEQRTLFLLKDAAMTGVGGASQDGAMNGLTVRQTRQIINLLYPDENALRNSLTIVRKKENLEGLPHEVSVIEYKHSLDPATLDIIASVWQPHFQQVIRESRLSTDEFIGELTKGLLGAEVTARLKAPQGDGGNYQSSWRTGLQKDRRTFQKELNKLIKALALKDEREITICLGGTLFDEIKQTVQDVDASLENVAKELGKKDIKQWVSAWRVRIRAISIATPALIIMYQQLQEDDMSHKDWVRFEYMDLLDKTQWPRLVEDPADIFIVDSSLYLGTWDFPLVNKREKDVLLSFVDHVQDFVKPMAMFVTEVPIWDVAWLRELAPNIPGFQAIRGITYYSEEKFPGDKTKINGRTGIYLRGGDGAIMVKNSDNAMQVEKGGIDLDRSKMQMNVSKDAGLGGVQVNFDPAQIARIKRDGFDGLEFKIESIVPANLSVILGLSAAPNT